MTSPADIKAAYDEAAKAILDDFLSEMKDIEAEVAALAASLKEKENTSKLAMLTQKLFTKDV